MKRFLENGARPVTALGGLETQPFGRLGALVFQLNNSDKLYWASLRAPTRIAGCALSYGSLTPAGKTFRPKIATFNPQRKTIKRMAASPKDGRSVFRFRLRLQSNPKRTPGSGRRHCLEGMHPQSAEKLSAQVALLQSLILSALRET
jgi:hypothetical protein